MDTKKLQLRLLSPILFKNKSSIDLMVQVYDQSFTLNNNSVFCLDYAIQKVYSITIKCNGNNQLVYLNESSVIKFENKFIVVSKKRRIETLQTTILFYVHYYFRNEMISNEQVLIKPYQVVPIPFFLPTSEILSFDIMETKFFDAVHVDLKVEDIKESRCFVSTKDKKGKQFILQFSLNISKMNIISISSFLIYYNSLSIPLIFGLSDEDKITPVKKLDLENESITNIFPFQEVNKIWKVDNPIMFSLLIKTDKSNEVKIYITSEYSSSWSLNPIKISNFDSSSDLRIPLNNEIVSLSSCYVLSNSNLQPNTFIFFISPKYAIINQTSETFSIDLFNGEPIKIRQNSTISITIIRRSLEFSVAIIPKEKKLNHHLFYSRRLNIEKINSQFVSVANVNSPVLFQMSVEKGIYYITMTLNRSLPYLFVNKTDFIIIFVQKDTCDSAHTVKPNESLAFYLYDENMPSIIYCDIKNEIKFEININVPSFPVHIDYIDQMNDLNLYYYVDLSTNTGSVITLINSIDNQILFNTNTSANGKFCSHSNLSINETSHSTLLDDLPFLKNDSFDLNFMLSQISIMIITEKYQEKCNITLKDIIINSIIREYETNTHAAIGSIKVDDQNKYAIYPSVFQILPDGNYPAFQINVNSFGSHKYGKIEIELREIIFQIDLSFISDFIGEIFYFENNQSLTDNGSSDSDLSSNDKNNENSNENVVTENFKFQMNGLPFTEIMHNIMPKQTKYHINKIIIHPFKVHVTFQTSTARAYHQLQDKYEINNLINFIPSFRNISISIDDIHSFLNLSGTTDEIVFKISHEIKKMILNQLSLKSSIMGTKKMLIKTVKCLFKPETATNITDGILNKANLCFSVCESTLCYLSSILNVYINAPPNIRTDVTSYEALSWGVSKLSSSFKEGAKELVVEPLNRGNVNGKNYFCGYLSGSIIGLTKCAVNMTSGICIFGASLFSCTRRLFFNESIVFHDNIERKPLLGMHCSTNDCLLWYTGSLSSCLIEVYAHSIYISKGDVFIKDFVNKIRQLLFIALLNHNYLEKSFLNFRAKIH